MSMLSMLKEDNGKYSFTRTTSFMLVVFYMICAIYLMIRKDILIEMPNTITMLIASVYGINKFSNIILSKDKKLITKEDSDDK